MTLSPAEGFTSDGYRPYSVVVAAESPMPTALEHVIDLMVQRTIRDHGGDLAAAAEALRCSHAFDADETARPLWCEAVERYRVAAEYVAEGEL